MYNIVYSKFADERATQFAIQTQILKNEKNNFKVKKCWLTNDSMQHVINMNKWEKELSVAYKDSTIEFANSQLEEDGVSFEYIEGMSFEVILDNLLEKKKYNELFDKIQYLFQIIREYNSQTLFEKTPQFIEIFGNYEFDNDMYCNKINNIDMIFSNIISRENKFVVIDYEWTFDFPVPVDYILYRILHNYIYSNLSRKVLIENDIWDLLGYSCKYLDIFENMENNFQKYILGKCIPKSVIYQDMKHENINVLQIINEKNETLGDSKVQIYKDFGFDFSEKHSIFMTPLEKDNKFSICFSIENNVSRIRFDPCNRCCMIIFSKFEDDKGNNYLDQLSSIGYKFNGHCYLFNNDDPWVSCILLDSTKELIIEYELIKGNNLEVFLNKLSLELDKQIQLKNMINLMSEEKNMLSNNNDILNQEIINMKNTLSWRITKPLRKIRNYFK